MEELIQDIIFIGKGVPVTLLLTLVSLVIGTFLGICFSVLRYGAGRLGQLMIARLISILRGVPLYVQLSIIYYPFAALLQNQFQIGLTPISAAIIAFGLNSSAYVAEILRAGIENMPKGQFEAAQTLNIPKFYMWKDIILPQVWRNVFPAMINETVSLLKETAIAAAVIGGVFDIMRKTELLTAQTFEYFRPLLIAAIFYYGLVLVIEFIGRQIYKGMSHATNS